ATTTYTPTTTITAPPTTTPTTPVTATPPTATTTATPTTPITATIPTTPPTPTTTTTTPTPPATTTTTTTVTPTRTTSSAVPTNTATTTTTPTTPTTTTTTTTAVPSRGQCQNGGTWEDGRCLCPEEFQGDRCQDPVCQNGGTWVNGFCQSPPYGSPLLGQVTLNATVEMTTKIDNRNLDDKLRDPSSPDYRQFEATFKEKMAKIYGHIEGYRDVVIKNLSSGSIVVEYDVIV
ncbi:MUC3A protein, partial [Melanocharis versteri]|nr:MUC3A protein [Melanocharis versteri]